MMKRLLCLLLCLLTLPALAETVQDQALAFIQDAGIEADAVTRVDNEVIVTLTNGGTASIWMSGDFDKYDLSWRFEGATDEDVGLYLDHALSLLAKLEAKIPADTSNLSTAESIRVRNYSVIVSNSLLYMEKTGQQGLRILLDKLSAHDDSGLNSLRARLASRLLGELDNSPVDPVEGLAWYDALELSVQDDLPLPDASVYVDDPFLAEITSLLIAHEEERRSWYTWGWDVDPAKTTTFVYLSSVTTRTEGDNAVVFCYMASEKIALYDGTKAEMLSGTWAPRRIELARVDGAWEITRVVETGGGTEYWPSIVAFCDGDEALAEALCEANTPELHEAHEAAKKAWLASIGYPDVTLE